MAILDHAETQIGHVDQLDCAELRVGHMEPYWAT